MTGPLSMLKLQPRMQKLASWAYCRGLVGRAGDLGYALHAALAGAFGEDAPKPFRLCDAPGNSRGSEAAPASLYAYCPADEEALQDRAALAEPDVFCALALDTLAVKPMPATWKAGRVLDVEVRVRPVIRCDASGDRSRTRERDAFLAALPPASAAGPGERVERESIYRLWLERELARGGAARALPGTLRMTGFQRTRVQRRGRADGSGGRAFRAPEGPDAIFAGSIQVEDGVAFAALLRRGIGRHRAFGFGMLLLRPAQARRGPPPC